MASSGEEESRQPARGGGGRSAFHPIVDICHVGKPAITYSRWDSDGITPGQVHGADSATRARMLLLLMLMANALATFTIPFQV